MNQPKLLLDQVADLPGTWRGNKWGLSLIGLKVAILLLIGCTSAPSAATPTSPTPSPTSLPPPSLAITPLPDSPSLTPQPSLEVVGQLGGASHTAFIQGEYGYLSVGLKMLVLRLADPAKPEALGAIILPEVGRDMAVLNNNRLHPGGHDRRRSYLSGRG